MAAAAGRDIDTGVRTETDGARGVEAESVGDAGVVRVDMVSQFVSDRADARRSGVHRFYPPKLLKEQILSNGLDYKYPIITQYPCQAFLLML